ncbi:hypothetical protein C8Q76DRAFT_798906 [Earliella scabrosa]|nr:hypothetical protein C8Q76DRAFT_798906 [Earliella scabrosa]
MALHSLDSRSQLLERRRAILDQQDQLRQEQTRLDCALKDVDYLLNATQPINRLPNEILTDIFDRSFNGALFLDDYSSLIRKTRVRPRGATARTAVIPSVCRHWRTVACGTPRLWQTIHIRSSSNPDWLALCLTRCAQVPAHVTLECTVDKKVVSILSSSRPIIRFLSIPRAEIRTALIRDLLAGGESWPRLETLHIESRVPLDRDDTGIQLHTSRFPVLHTLTLDGLALPRDRDPSTYPNNLRNLTLRTRAWRISVDHILAIAGSMPHLESLDMRIASSIYQSPPPRNTIVLPALHTLVLSINLHQVAKQALAVLQFPAATEVSIKVYVTLQDPQTMFSILPPDPTSVFPSLATMDTVDLLISSEHECYQIRARSARGGTISFTLTSREDVDWDSGFPHYLEDLGRLFSAAPLTTLNICADSFGVDSITAPVPTWSSVLARLPALESCTLSGSDYPHEFWEALQGIGPSSTSAVNDIIPCPRLKVVKMLGWWTIECQDARFLAMPNALRHRAALGHRLEYLDVISLDVANLAPDEEYVQQLEQVVGELMWERREGRS